MGNIETAREANAGALAATGTPAAAAAPTASAAPAAPPAPAATPPPAATPAEPAPKAEAPAVGGVTPSREESPSAPGSVDRSGARGQAAESERRSDALSETVTVQQERAAGALARAVALPDVVSPDPRIRWRVGPGSVVQHSADRGATWITQQTGASAALTAGSAPAADVLWIVGRRGVVLRTTDARPPVAACAVSRNRRSDRDHRIICPQRHRRSGRWPALRHRRRRCDVEPRALRKIHRSNGGTEVPRR